METPYSAYQKDLFKFILLVTTFYISVCLNIAFLTGATGVTADSLHNVLVFTMLVVASSVINIVLTSLFLWRPSTACPFIPRTTFHWGDLWHRHRLFNINIITWRWRKAGADTPIHGVKVLRRCLLDQIKPTTPRLRSFRGQHPT